MPRVTKKLTGILTVGQGKSRELKRVVVSNPYGDEESVDIHISADSRLVWLSLSADEAYSLADAIRACVKID